MVLSEATRQLKTAGAASSAEEKFWRERLTGLGEKACFPADLQPRTDAESARGTHRLRLPLHLTERLEKLSRGRPAALHVALTGGLIALLRQYTRADEIVVGQPPQADGPNAAEQPSMMLVLRSAPAGDATFRDLLTDLRVAVLEAVRHQSYPVASLAPELGRTAPAGENPYFDVAIELAGLHQAGFGATVPTRMLFSATCDDTGIEITVHYDATRFTLPSVERIAQQYALLLVRATAEPDEPMHQLDLSAPEDDAVVTASNDTAAQFDSDATIHDCFVRQALATPDAIALVGLGGLVTFAELDDRSTRLARTLCERGVGPNDLVGVLAERSVEMVVALLAVLKSGGAYLPIDPAYPRARIDYLLADSGARLVLAQRKLASLAGDVPVLDLHDAGSYAGDAEPLGQTSTSADLAYVIYTSGSTGQPKGVMVEHRSVVNRLAWMQRAYPIGPGDVILQKTSISFDVSVWELFWWAFTGASLALLEPGGEKDPEAIVAAVERHRVTTMHFVPSMLSMFLSYVDRFGGERRLESLRQVFASGEALGRDQAHRFAGLVADARLVNLYGPTEATVDVTYQPCDALGDQARVPIGRPIDNTRTYVLDELRRPVPVGVPGELYIAGVGLARGYLKRDELTRDRFVAGESVGEDRLYRTGDLARWLPDGTIDYLGRIDAQVKVRGFRVEPGEIEARLRAHPAVEDAAVVAHDQGWQTSLRGFVVLREEASEDELKQHLGAALPAFMVPAQIVSLAAMPLTPNGKLDRGALMRPDELRRQDPGDAGPPDARQETLIRIWREVLGLEQVGVHDNFFALGGNSIHFVSVLARARAAGLTFTFQQLFQHQTIAALTRALAQDTSDAVPDVAARGAFQPFELLAPRDRALLPAGVEDAYPLSMLQAGLIFQTEITGGMGQYHDVLSYLIRGAFDAETFEQAVRLLVRRHPALRTTYHLTGFSELIQMVHRDVAPPLHVVDLRGRDPREQVRWHDAWLAREKARRFVWEEGALVSLHVEILRDDLYRYTVSQHNSALDGWSISLLHTQLFDLYFRIREGRTTEERAVDNHLRNFVGLEREARRSTSSRDFWLDVVRDREPTVVPRSAGARETSDFRVILHDVALPAGLTERIDALAEALSVPVKDVLLAAHVKVLGAISGRTEVVTGYEHSGRPELPDAEAALGLFLNTVPLRIELVDGSWEQLIRDVYQAELDLLPHRRYPMAQMKQDLGTQRPFFETTFNFTHFYMMKQLRELPELALLDLRVDSETEFPLRTEFSHHFFEDDVRLSLHYHDHLFGVAQIERIGGYFVRVLELMTSEPHARHAGRSLVDEQELVSLRGFAGASHEVCQTRYRDLADGGSWARPYVLDGQSLLAPLGAPGDIVIGGLERHQVRVPLADPVEPGRYVAPTGDRGRWLPDGRLQILEQTARPDPAPAASEPTDMAPASAETEAAMQRIAAVWAEVLDVPLERIDGAAGFFALGGNSLSALRVVVELDGLVTLTDLTRHDRLEELARLAVHRQHGDHDLLHLLSSTAAGTTCALVCVPYPGGHPINFRPLAETLEEQTSDIAVYGVEPPGHSLDRPGQVAGVAETARLIVAEVVARGNTPVILWGHCGGAAVTMEVARRLEQQGCDLRHVFIGSKLLPSITSMRESIELIDGWSDEDIIRYMVEETGYSELDGLDRRHSASMTRLFRHDVCDGYRYFISDLQEREQAQAQTWKLAAPLTCVFAADDAGLVDFLAGYEGWGAIATDIRLHVLSRGGHYFVRANPSETADLVERAWASSAAQPED
jgi:amino acid adenylation domain-containing protein